MADQARGNAVEDPPQDEAATRCDKHARLFAVGGSPLGQRLECGALDLDALAVAGIAPPDHFVDEAPIGGEVGEVARAAQQKLVAKHLLEVPVRALDCAVLVSDAWIVARRRHAVMGAQFLVASRQVILGVAIKVAERRRQAVAAVLLRHPAQRPQRVLQAFGERHEALAAEHYMGICKAREGEPEVIEPVQQRRARNRDAKRAHVGEVRQAHPPRRVFLAEHHIPAGAVERPPSRDAALQSPPHAHGEISMPAADLLEDRDRADTGCGLKHRYDLALPHSSKRVGPAAPTGLGLLRWQPRINFNPIRGGDRKPRLRGCDSRGMASTGLHVQPRLAIGDVSARQALILLGGEESDAAPNRSDRQTNVRPPGENAPRRGWPDYGRATPSLRQPIPGAFLILIVAQFSPCLSRPSLPAI